MSAHKRFLESSVDDHFVNLVWKTLVQTADEDYLLARTLAWNFKPRQFYWSAAQSIEKYLKAILLLCDENVSKYSHNISTMLEKVSQHFPHLADWNMAPPWNLAREQRSWPYGEEFTWWWDTSIQRYVAGIAHAGCPDNRYRSWPIRFHGAYLHQLDDVIFQLRRLTFPFDRLYPDGRRRASERASKSPAFDFMFSLFPLFSDQRTSRHHPNDTKGNFPFSNYPTVYHPNDVCSYTLIEGTAITASLGAGGTATEAAERFLKKTRVSANTIKAYKEELPHMTDAWENGKSPCGYIFENQQLDGFLFCTDK